MCIRDRYWERDETAIRETDLKYGRFCHSLALNILSLKEEAEECVNDTYHRAWNSIPPERPRAFRAWLGRIVRNLSINLSLIHISKSVQVYPCPRAQYYLNWPDFLHS